MSLNCFTAELKDSRALTLISVACVAGVSLLFPSKDRAKNGSRFISRAAKTENLVPRSFFASKQHGNACYAGYDICEGHGFLGSNMTQISTFQSPSTITRYTPSIGCLLLHVHFHATRKFLPSPRLSVTFQLPFEV